MRYAETAIVGGGPAGAAAACCLATAGADVIVLERSGAPHHKVCGEFLSIETIELLRSLGIDAGALGAAPIDHLALHFDTRTLRTHLPFRALSLSRLRLDAVLLRRAEVCGAQVQRNVAARGFERNSRGWTLHIGNNETIGCRNLVVATGKWGFRGIKDDRDQSLVGLKIHLRLPKDATCDLARTVNLHFFDGGYAGLGLVENETANLCALVNPKTLPLRGASWIAIKEFLDNGHSTLGRYLAAGEPLWERPIVVTCPTRGYLHRQGDLAFYRVGDRLAHIPPFTGDGLAIALSTGVLAATHIRDSRSPEQYYAAARKLTASSVGVASSLALLISSKPIRTAILGWAGHWPSLIETIVQRTRIGNIN